MSPPCVFCLRNAQLDERQILLRGTHLYVCAPRGQLVEGCLIIAPFDCVGCFAHAPASHLAELAALTAIVDRFYADVYGVECASYYEQGRAGGGAATDALGGFPHHAHLCCLPVEVDLHLLLRNYAAEPVEELSDAAAASGGRPYAYVDAVGGRAVYVARTQAAWTELERLRLKPRIAELLGLDSRAVERRYPDGYALDRAADHLRRAMNGAA